jgi:uncharacterized RDD family membrane protein YckC
MRERNRLEVPLPERAVDRVLLGLGAVALLALVPLLWTWLLYGSGLSGSAILVGGVGLCLLTAGVGTAMIRILDGAGE